MTESNEENILSCCPHCGNKLELPVNYLGGRIDCVSCGEEYEVKAEPKDDITPQIDAKEQADEIKAEDNSAVQPEKQAEVKAEEDSEIKTEIKPEVQAEEKAAEKTEVKAEEKAEETPQIPASAPGIASEQKIEKNVKPQASPAPIKNTEARKPNRAKTAGMVKKYSDEVSPDSLMTDFKPKGIIIIAIFTIIVHVLLLGGTSINFLMDKFITKPKELPEEKRKSLALDAATRAINEIAEKYDLTSSDVTSQFSDTGSRADKVTSKGEDKKGPEKKPEKKTEEKPEKKPEEKPKEKSELEQKFEKKEEGPDEFDFKDDF